MSWWDTKHKEESKQYLTGSNIQQYLELYDCTEEFLAANRILEVGVGLGVALEGMIARGKNVDFADISQVAIDKWGRIAKGYKVTELPIDSYDLVFMNLVAQHTLPGPLKWDIGNIIKSMVKTGTFCLQTADTLTNLTNERTHDVADKGGILHQPYGVCSMVNEGGGRVIWMGTRILPKQVVWHMYKIRRNV